MVFLALYIYNIKKICMNKYVYLFIYIYIYNKHIVTTFIKVVTFFSALRAVESEQWSQSKTAAYSSFACTQPATEQGCPLHLQFCLHSACYRATAILPALSLLQSKADPTSAVLPATEQVCLLHLQYSLILSPLSMPQSKLEQRSPHRPTGFAILA